MEYSVAYLTISDSMYKEVMIAELAMLEYDSFEETDTGIRAYIPETALDKAALEQVVAQYAEQTTIKVEKIERLANKNWNAVWESNFQPLIINEQVLIKAPFHQLAKTYPYEILIEPKMAFGTGHHATTHMMIQQMLVLDFQQKKVLDFGCGTGILAIMARMLGAKEVLAIDYDQWAYENTLENLAVNNITQITVKKGSEEQIHAQDFDIILANINKNIITQTLDNLYHSLKIGGLLLLSGILPIDQETILTQTADCPLSLYNTIEKDNWLLLAFTKEQ